MKHINRGGIAAFLLGVVLATPAHAFDQVNDGFPRVGDGSLWGRSTGTTNTKQDVTTTSGALDVNIKSGSTTPPTGASSTQVQGTAASAAASVGNPVQIGAPDAGGTMRADTTISSPADGNTNGLNLLGVWSANAGFNGTTWDKWRTAGIGNNVASTGLGVSAPYGQYLTLANQPALTTGNYADTQLDSVGNQKVTIGAPAIGNILAGRQTFSSTTAATTLVTITAGKTFVGTIGSSVDCNEAAAATVACQAKAIFTTVGAGTTPAAGTYFGCQATSGANAATGTVGSQGANFCSTPFIASCASGTCTIAVTTTQAGTASLVEAFANGVMQ